VMIEFDEALSFLLKKSVEPQKVEKVLVARSFNRVIAEDLFAPFNVPLFDNSQVDGYALGASAMKAGKKIKVSQRIAAGDSGKEIQPEEAARIFTGARVPAGTKAIAMQEDVENSGHNIICLKSDPRPMENIRFTGADLKRGNVFFKKGRCLSAADIGLCSSVGLKTIKVFEKIRVGVFSSGNELRQPGEKLNACEIYDSNRPMILNMIERLGMQAHDLGCLPDDFDITVQALESASSEVDIILTCGGVSVGEEDHIKKAVQMLGSLDLWKINIKPGKPFALGNIQGRPLLGLPGNPVSSWVTFSLFCRPFLLSCSGHTNVILNPENAVSDFSFSNTSKKRLFLRASKNEEGRLYLFKNQNSQILSSICFSQGLVELLPGQTVEIADNVQYLDFSKF